MQVSFRKQPELYDDNSTYNLSYAMKVLDGSDATSRVLGSVQHLEDRMTDDDVLALIARGRLRKQLLFATDEQDYASEPDKMSDTEYDDEDEDDDAPLGLVQYDAVATDVVSVDGGDLDLDDFTGIQQAPQSGKYRVKSTW